MIRKREALLVGLTVLAVGAGVVAGMVASRLPASEGAAGGTLSQQSALAAQLDLTPDQSTQMREIWEVVRDKVRQSYEGADRLSRQRDEAIAAMLTTEQKAKFEKLTQDYADRFAILRIDRDSSFREAVEKTRKLLADDQRRKYDEMLKAVRPDQFQAAATGPAR